MTKYFVCYGPNDSHINDNIECFELYRDAIERYNSIPNEKAKYCYKATYDKNGIIKHKEAKQYSFDFNSDIHHMLVKLGLL